METQTMTLTDFLLARIAEDAEAARVASRVRETRTGDAWSVRRGRHGLDRIERAAGNAHDVGEVIVEAAPHIARHDPARVLAECEAKRQIVVACQWAEPWSNLSVARSLTSAVVRALALPYADHPDYDEDWRP